MVPKLQKFYALLLAPAAAGFLFLLVNDRLAIIDLPRMVQSGWIGPSLFLAAVVFGVALPVLMRTLLAYNTRHLAGVEPQVMLHFQHRLIGTALAASYLALLAHGLQVESFYCAATLLVALYAVYYFCPVRKRIEYDCRLFRVRS